MDATLELGPSYLSEKQQDFLAFSNAFVNIAEGAVRSGKTHVCLHRFIEHALTAPPGNMMILGKTGDTIARNVIEPLNEMFPVKYVRGKYVKIGPRMVYLVGANDEGAEQKVRGATLAGAYINEITLAPKSVFNQLIARCSIEGSKIFGDTNPDSPYHWLRQDYILNPENSVNSLYSLAFTLEDNETLADWYKDNLKRLYSSSPMWYARMIDGKWVAAEGAIYDMFSDDQHVVDVVPRTFDRIAVGVDYGTASVTTFIAAGRNNGKWWVFREYYYDARKEMRQKSNDEFAKDFIDFIDGVGYKDHVGSISPMAIEVDPSATGLKIDLRQHGVMVRPADHDVIEGIRNVQDALAQNDLRIARWCTNTIMEHSGYVWDEEKQREWGEDVPVKKNDHTCDALRYLLKRQYGRASMAPVDKAAGS